MRMLGTDEPSFPHPAGDYTPYPGGGCFPAPLPPAPAPSGGPGGEDGGGAGAGARYEGDVMMLMHVHTSSTGGTYGGSGEPGGQGTPAPGCGVGGGSTGGGSSSSGQHSPCDVAEAGTCAGCGGRIQDRYYLLAVDKQWHAHCLKCSCCHVTLDSELTCFAKDGQIFCKEDYYRKFAVKSCARCRLGIASNELVMKARSCVYHLACFACVSCNKQLTTGEHFGMKGELIFCKTHYELVDESFPHPDGKHDPMYFPASHQAPTKGRPRKRKSGAGAGVVTPPGGADHMSELMAGLQHGECGWGLEDDGLLDSYHMGGGSGQPRQKRIRTSFKHHQLRILKSYFALNQNPDAKDLKQLAQKTGLTKRVLQVWFQNARAKYRRNLLRQEGGAGHGEPAIPKLEAGGSPRGSSHDSTQLNLSADFSQASNNEFGSSYDESRSPPLSSTPPTDHQPGGGLSQLFAHSISTLN